MKSLLFVLSLFSFTAFAGVICVNPTTQFYLTKGPIGYDLTLSSPYGPKFTPIYDGQIPPFALSQLELDSEVIQSLGKLLKITFAEGACVESDGLVKCTDGSSENPRVSSVRFYTTKVIEESLIAASYTFLRVTLVMQVDGTQYRVSSRYNIANCSL